MGYQLDRKDAEANVHTRVCVDLRRVYGCYGDVNKDFVSLHNTNFVTLLFDTFYLTQYITYYLYTILFHSGLLMMVAWGLKHVGTLCVVIQHKYLRHNIVHFVRWRLSTGCPQYKEWTTQSSDYISRNCVLGLSICWVTEESIFSIKALILTVRNQSARRKFCPSTDEYATNSTRIGYGLKPDLQ